MNKQKTPPFRTPPPPPSRTTCACGSTAGVSPKLPDWYSNPYELGVICEDCVDDMIELESTKEYF